MKPIAPVALFTYNRLAQTKQTVEALQNNTLASETTVHIFSDGPKQGQAATVEAVREYLKTISGFKEVIIHEREKNFGLADSLVGGISEVLENNETVIVLEDDIVTSPMFLQHMNDALSHYAEDERVMHINGYAYDLDTAKLPDTYFSTHASCWGWATWRRAWSHFNPDAENLLKKLEETNALKTLDLDGKFKFSSTLRANVTGKQKTWAIKWYASIVAKQGLCLNFKESLTRNVGFDHQATNAHTNVFGHAPLSERSDPFPKVAREIDTQANRQLQNFFASRRPSWKEKVGKYKESIFTEHFFHPRWYSVFINPYFISRRRLNQSIKSFAEEQKIEGDLLDVGCGLKPFAKYFGDVSYLGIDIAGGGHADAAKTVDAWYDGVNIPFPDESFSAIICTEVMEHASQPEKLMEEIARVLKPGGILYLTTPFTYPEHEIPYDFRRYTSYGQQKLLSDAGLKLLSTKKTTGFFGTAAQLFSVSLFEGIPFRSSILKLLLTMAVLAPIQALGVILDAVFGRKGITLNYVSIANKS